MALYAMGDCHLAFQVDKTMSVFGEVWNNHETKIRQQCRQLIHEEDTLVLTGDHSWGRNLSQCETDLLFIQNLPGRKILTRGNHDMFWDAKKTQQLNDMFQPELFFLQDNYAVYQDYALVGTKGFTFEGPFYMDRNGNVLAWDHKNEAHAKKLIAREMKRLRHSFALAQADGYTKFIMFLHYPPTNIMETESDFTRIAEEYQVEHVVYSHCHGKERFHDSIIGEFHGIQYHLVSGDYLNFKPVKILD